MAADALSDVLRTVRLTGAVFFDVAAKAPWVAEQPTREMVLPKILPGAEHLIAYHVVTEGRCFASIVGAEPIAVEAGEVIVFTKGDPHVMSSSPGMRADPVTRRQFDAADCRHRCRSSSTMAATGRPRPSWSAASSPAMRSRSIRCSTTCRRSSRPETRRAAMRAGSASSSAWRSVEFADKRAGGESVLAKLSELMFIEVVRRHLEDLPPEQAGWLAGPARPVRRQGIVADAWQPGAQLDDRGTGQGRRRCRARCWPSVSPTSSACRRCSISPNGGCRSLRGC